MKMPKTPELIRIKDTSLLEAFFVEKNVATALNIPTDEGLKTFLDSIYIEILDGHDAQRAAESTLRLLELVAASHAAQSRTSSYQMVGELEDELAEVISQTLGVPGRNRTGI